MEEEGVGELEDLFIRNLKKAMFALLSWFLHNPRGGEVVYLKQSRRCCSVLASDCRLSWTPGRRRTIVTPDSAFSPALKLLKLRFVYTQTCTFLVCGFPSCRMHTSPFWVADATLVQGWFILLEVRILFCVVWIFLLQLLLNTLL